MLLKTSFHFFFLLLLCYLTLTGVFDLRAVTKDQESIIEAQEQSIANFDSSASSIQGRHEEMRGTILTLEASNNHLKEDLRKQTEGEIALQNSIKQLKEVSFVVIFSGHDCVFERGRT